MESKNCAQAVWIGLLSNWFSASFDEPYVWVEADPSSCRDIFFIRNPSLWAYPLQYFMKHLPQSVKWSWAISKKWAKGEEISIMCEKSAWLRLFDMHALEDLLLHQQQLTVCWYSMFSFFSSPSPLIFILNAFILIRQWHHFGQTALCLLWFVASL